MENIDNTGDIDIRVVRKWLKNRESVFHGTCSSNYIAGFDDAVFLTCFECSEKIYIGLDTYIVMKREVNV